MEIKLHEPDPRLATLYKAIENNTVNDATDEQLQEWLVALCLDSSIKSTSPGYLPINDIIKGITVNQIQTDRRNRRANRLIITLASATIFVGIIQALIAYVSYCKLP